MSCSAADIHWSDSRLPPRAHEQPTNLLQENQANSHTPCSRHVFRRIHSSSVELESDEICAPSAPFYVRNRGLNITQAETTHLAPVASGPPRNSRTPGSSVSHGRSELLHRRCRRFVTEHRCRLAPSTTSHSRARDNSTKRLVRHSAIIVEEVVAPNVGARAVPPLTFT